MEWKDNAEKEVKDEASKEEYFDEEQYSPWADQKNQKKRLKITRSPVLFLLLLAIVALIATLLMLVMDSGNDPADQQKVAVLEGKINQLEERLDKYEAIDEKVTLIWEQAKSFEKFKDRFDRSEASMSLRMDHLTMSLEAMQKQPTPKAAIEAPTAKTDSVVSKSTKRLQYHQVKAGETLYSISKRYGLKVDALRSMNKMTPGSVIVTGQKLIIRTTAN